MTVELFDPTLFGPIPVRNRFIRSATFDGLADSEGHVTDQQIDLFTTLAEGGVGLIVTGGTYVDPTGQLSTTHTSASSDDCIPGLKRLTQAVHARGARIVLQLFHAGRYAQFVRTRGLTPRGPSVIVNDPYFEGEDYESFSEAQIETLVEAFGEAARRAREAGFDAVQLHAAHGFLFSQFLSPHTNRRQDRWGGVLENRLRFHTQVIDRIQSKVGSDFPILIKLGLQDAFPEGMPLAEGLRAARLLEAAGVAAIEVSLGVKGIGFENAEYRMRLNSIEKEGYYRDWAHAAKNTVDIPIALVGGLRTLSLMQTIVDNGEADFISMARPLIKEPDLIRRWAAASREAPTCTSCNLCLKEIMQFGPVDCYLES